MYFVHVLCWKIKLLLLLQGPTHVISGLLASCIVTTNPSRTGLNPLNKVIRYHMYDRQHACYTQGFITRYHLILNSMNTRDAAWHLRKWLTLFQIMACLTAPAQYLNQCWLISNEVLQCSTENGNVQETNKNILENHTFNLNMWGPSYLGLTRSIS